MSFIAACLLSIAPLVAHSAPDLSGQKYSDLELIEGGCNSNCSLVMDYGSVRFWYYVDGNGKTYLDYTEELPGKLHRETLAEPVVYSHTPPRVGAFAKTGAGPDGCGSDGWGWGSGENISNINYGMFSLSTNYSHAGHAVRVSINNETGEIIGNPTGVASGIRVNIPVRCELRRDAIQEK